MYNLISNTESLVCSESDWIREGTDLAALGCAADRGWLNTFLADAFNTISRTATSVSAQHYLSRGFRLWLLRYSAVLFPLPMIIIASIASFPKSFVAIVWNAFSDLREQKLFRTQEQKIKTGDEALYLVSLERLENVLRTVITILAAILLLVPVYVLFKLKSTDMSPVERNSNYQILTIFISTMIFSASCSIFTQANKNEVFTATAAYSAVLVVFLGGNMSNVKVAINN